MVSSGPTSSPGLAQSGISFISTSPARSEFTLTIEPTESNQNPHTRQLTATGRGSGITQPRIEFIAFLRSFNIDSLVNGKHNFKFVVGQSQVKSGSGYKYKMPFRPTGTDSLVDDDNDTVRSAHMEHEPQPGDEQVSTRIPGVDGLIPVIPGVDEFVEGSVAWVCVLLSYRLVAKNLISLPSSLYSIRWPVSGYIGIGSDGLLAHRASTTLRNPRLSLSTMMTGSETLQNTDNFTGEIIIASYRQLLGAPHNFNIQDTGEQGKVVIQYTPVGLPDSVSASITISTSALEVDLPPSTAGVCSWRFVGSIYCTHRY